MIPSSTGGNRGEEEGFLIFEPAEAHLLSMAELQYNLRTHMKFRHQPSDIQHTSSSTHEQSHKQAQKQVARQRREDYTKGMLTALENASAYRRRGISEVPERVGEHGLNKWSSMQEDGQRDTLAYLLEELLERREADLKVLEVLGWNDEDLEHGDSIDVDT